VTEEAEVFVARREKARRYGAGRDRVPRVSACSSVEFRAAARLLWLDYSNIGGYS